MQQQMFTASQLRQIHEERIAPYINDQSRKVAKPKKETRKVSGLGVLSQVLRVVQS